MNEDANASIRWNPIYTGDIYFDDGLTPSAQVSEGGRGDVAPNVQGGGGGMSMGGYDMPETQAGGPSEMQTRPMAERPTTAWLFLVFVLVIFIWISRKFGGPEKFGNIKLTLWNALFATFFMILMFNFFKAAAPYVARLPFGRGVAELFTAA